MVCHRSVQKCKRSLVSHTVSAKCEYVFQCVIWNGVIMYNFILKLRSTGSLASEMVSKLLLSIYHVSPVLIIDVKLYKVVL